jgi:hypothetical protein
MLLVILTVAVFRKAFDYVIQFLVHVTELGAVFGKRIQHEFNNPNHSLLHVFGCKFLLHAFPKAEVF